MITIHLTEIYLEHAHGVLFSVYVVNFFLSMFLERELANLVRFARSVANESGKSFAKHLDLNLGVILAAAYQNGIFP